MSSMKDITGQKFGKITVIRQSLERAKCGNIRWHGLCECGNTTVSSGYDLRAGRAISCGCHGRGNTRHKQSGSVEHNTWAQIRQRCNNPNCPDYRNYGGRGISVDQSWDSFEQFYKDMGPRPGKRYSIDRIDNDGPYSADNCRWATRKQQNNNTRRNVLLNHDGRTATISEWSQRMNVSYHIIHSRIARGWSTDRALTEPVRGTSR